MADIAINRTITYRTTVCITCGVDIVLAASRYDWCLNHHEEQFYCPNGHGQYFAGETAEARLKKQLAEKQAALEMKERALAFERQRTVTLESQQVKLKKRIAAGVCPCCHRTVSQLARHMKTKHPAFTKA